MPLTEDSVRCVKLNNDEECFVCDEKMKRGDISIGVKFVIPLPLGVKLDVVKYMHPTKCAPGLRNIIDAKIEQARRA